MNRATLSLAVLAIFSLSTQVFAAATPADAQAKQPMNKPPILTHTPASTISTAPPADLPPKVLSATFNKIVVNALDPLLLKIDGQFLSAGKDCAGEITWGDGTKFNNFLGANGNWNTLTKIYDKAGVYSVTVTPKSYKGAPCVSGAKPVTALINVNPPTPLPPSTMTKLVLTPTLIPLKLLISTKWDGGGNPKGACYYTLSFGDGQNEKVSVGQVQPGADTQHAYAAPGTYTVSIVPYNTDYAPCSLGPDAAPKTITIQ